MENNQNPAGDGGESPNKSGYVSPEETIARMRLAFENGKDPEILSVMTSVGYTEEQLNGFLAQVAVLEEMNQKQAKEYGEQYNETKKLNEKREQIDSIFKRHRNLSKIHLKNDLQAWTALRLEQGRILAYPAWLQLVKNFYAQFLGDETLKEKVAAINIKDNDIAAQQQAIAQLEALKVSQKKETAEAQKATENRDEGLDALYPKYRDFVDYAVELFGDDQTLEKLGIVVRR